MVILYARKRSKEIEWEWMLFTVYKQERTIFTKQKWQQMIFIVEEQEQSLLQYSHFQDLMRNDQEMTKKWPRNDQEMTKKWRRYDLEMAKKWLRMNKKSHSWFLMTDITRFHSLSMNGLVTRFYKTISSANLSYHPNLSNSILLSCSQMAILLMLGLFNKAEAVSWTVACIIKIFLRS